MFVSICDFAVMLFVVSICAALRGGLFGSGLVAESTLHLALRRAQGPGAAMGADIHHIQNPWVYSGVQASGTNEAHPNACLALSQTTPGGGAALGQPRILARSCLRGLRHCVVDLFVDVFACLFVDVFVDVFVDLVVDLMVDLVVDLFVDLFVVDVFVDLLLMNLLINLLMFCC